MNKKMLVILAVLLTGIVSGETIKEKTFFSIGYEEELKIHEANAQECMKIIFYDEFNSEEFTIISVHYTFTPNIKGDANITVELNNKLISIIESGTGNEFQRITLKKEELKTKNELRICGNSSDSIPKINVYNDSIIGNYKTAFFPEGSFTKKVVSKELVVGQEIHVKTTLKNYGNESTFVKITDGDKERKDIELIKGKSSFSGEIQAGKEISLEFTYRLKNPNTRLLPNAVAVYLNEFKEEKTIKSNYPEILPKEYKKKLEPIIMLKKQINQIKEESEIEIVIINNSLETVHNAKITVLGKGIELKKNEKKFASIHPKQIVYFKTKIKSNTAGKFELGCTLEFEGKKVSCEKTEIIFEKEEIKQELIAGMLFVLFGVAIYLYLYLR